MERRHSSPLHQNCYCKGGLNLLQSGDIFAKNVKLDVDYRTYTDVAEVSVLESVGDDGYLEGVSCWIANREAYAINGNTAFVDSEIAFQCHLTVLWIFECEIG